MSAGVQKLDLQKSHGHLAVVTRQVKNVCLFKYFPETVAYPGLFFRGWADQ